METPGQQLFATLIGGKRIGFWSAQKVFTLGVISKLLIVGTTPKAEASLTRACAQSTIVLPRAQVNLANTSATEVG